MTEPAARQGQIAGRVAQQLVLHTIRLAQQEQRLELEAAPTDVAGWQPRKVLPPYLGEMGVEIRYFLAAVEPWLRNGWRIPARRPEFYPPGTAFADPELFAELASVLDEAGAKPLTHAYNIVERSSHPYEVEADLHPGAGLTVRVRCADVLEIRRAMKIARLERSVRQIFARRHMRWTRPVTPWDDTLTSVFDARPEHLCGGAIVLAPGYQPDAFLNPAAAADPHVGVQLRRIGFKPDRNSHVADVLAAARAAAGHLGLPLLVYGDPGGTTLPEDLPNTHAQCGGQLLRFELAMLRGCRVMFAPDSGWCDLMCWLRVPTILEGQSRPNSFSGMHVFHPRVVLHDPGAPIAAQVDRLLATPQALPPAARDGRDDDLDWDGPWIGRLAGEFVNL